MEVSQKEAVDIAKDFVKNDTDLDRLRIVVEDEGDRFLVKFKLKEGLGDGIEGGGSGYVDVDKCSGRILRFYISK